jgi:hypothetical protein
MATLEITKETFVAHAHPDRVKALAAANNESWIAKVCNMGASEGIEMFFANSPFWTGFDPVNKVLQRYVDRPLLLDGRKWHWRTWVLCTSWSPTRCWSTRDLGFAHRGVKQFELQHGDVENTRRVVKLPAEQPQTFDTDIHMTFPTDDQLSYNETLDRIEQQWGRDARERMIRSLYRKYGVMLANWPAYVQAELANAAWAIHYKPMPCNCFDLFGMDIMIEIDDNDADPLNPIVLEVNVGPDLTFQHTKTETCMQVIYDAKMPLLRTLFDMIHNKVTSAAATEATSPQFEHLWQRFVHTQQCDDSTDCGDIDNGATGSLCRFLHTAEARTLLWQVENEHAILSPHFDLVYPFYDAADDHLVLQEPTVQTLAQQRWLRWRNRG